MQRFKQNITSFFRDFKVSNRVMVIKLNYISLGPAIVRLGLSPEVTLNKEDCKVIKYFRKRIRNNEKLYII